MECQGKECDGIIDETQTESIFTPCGGSMSLHPCSRCGLLHWEINGSQLIDNRTGMEVFLKDGRVFRSDGQETDLENNFQTL